MVPHFLSLEAEHPVEGNEHGEEFSHHKHMFRLEPKILLYVPKPNVEVIEVAAWERPRYVS
jgi:hypothetical protein